MAGPPQGSPISPLLANIALHLVDTEWETTSSTLGTLVRYADDMLILSRSQYRAEEARRRIETILATLGLQLHPEKTRIVHIGDGSDGFDFSRRPSEAAYARLAGVAPIPANSGQTQDRHRLNRGGDRQLNNALHTVAVTRIRAHPPTQNYKQRRLAEGKTDREIRRCIKRYIARRVWRLLENPPLETAA